MSGSRELEWSEYLKTLTPKRVQAIAVQNGQLLREREGFKIALEALTRDLREKTRAWEQTRAQYAEAATRVEELEAENARLQSRLRIYTGGAG